MGTALELRSEGITFCIRAMVLGAERGVRLQEEPRPRWKPEPLAGSAGSLLGVVGSVPGRPHTKTTLKGCGFFVYSGLEQVQCILQMAAEMQR